MMHALEARRRGHEVVHLEREPVPRGASVRNFGLIWVSGRAPGAELELALRARARWAQIAVQVPGTGFRAVPSLTLAANEAELSLLKEAASLPDAGLRGYELLGPDECRAVNAALRGESPAGSWAAGTRSSSPARCCGVLRAHLAVPGPGRLRPGCRAGRPPSSSPHAVRDHTGAWHRGDLVILCPGAAHSGIAGPHLAAWGARRCAGCGCR